MLADLFWKHNLTQNTQTHRARGFQLSAFLLFNFKFLLNIYLPWIKSRIQINILAQPSLFTLFICMFCQVCHIYCHFQDKEAYSQIPSCENASGAKKERWLEYEDTLWKRKKKVIVVIQTFFLPSQYVKIHVQQILA